MKLLKLVILTLLMTVTFNFKSQVQSKPKKVSNITKIWEKKLKISFLPGLTDEQKAIGRKTVGCKYQAQLLKLVEQTDSYEIWTYSGDGTTRDITVNDGDGDGMDPCANAVNFYHYVNVSFDYIEGSNLIKI